LQDFFRVDDEFKDRATVVANTACRKLVTDMHYEARIQAVVYYYRKFLKVKLTETDARNMRLTRAEYIQINIRYLLN